MSFQLDASVEAARDLDGAWDDARSHRVREGALRVRDARIRHKRQIRRGIAAAGGVCLLALGVLRAGAFAAPPSDLSSSASDLRGDRSSELVAARSVDDAGFTRD